MGKDIRWRSAVIAIVAILVALVFSRYDIRWGLDLQGGTELTYTADLNDINIKIKIAEEKGDSDEVARLYNQKDEMISKCVDILRDRLNNAGLEEIRVQSAAEKILIQLPGMESGLADEVKDVLKRQGILEFRLVNEDPEKIGQFQSNPGAFPGWELKESDKEQLLLEPLDEDMRLVGEDIASASPKSGRFGDPIVGVKFTVQGGRKMKALTEAYAEKAGRPGRKLAILLDGKVKSAPTLKAVLERECVIEGRFTPREQVNLINVLKSGSLPLKVKLDSENTVGSSLGADSIQSGKLAFIVGAAAVFLFMAIYYLVGGLISDFALALNFFILFACLMFFKATLTLPGIAGLVLTLGMAVDANVLIFERIREELRKGKQLGMAVVEGYDRAFVTIVDSNLTTLITAFILTVVGTEAVKGFGTTLLVGILTSMFTALFITRTVFYFLLDRNILTSFKMLALFKDEVKIRFTKLRFLSLGVSIVVIAIGMTFFVKLGKDNYDMDFNGGSNVQIALAEGKQLFIKDVRDRVAKAAKEDEFGFAVKDIADPKEKEDTMNRIAELREKIANAKVQSYWGTSEQQQGLKGEARNFTFETEIGSDEDLTRFVDFLKRTFKDEVIPPAVEAQHISADKFTEEERASDNYKQGRHKWAVTINFQDPVFAEYAKNAVTSANLIQNNIGKLWDFKYVDDNSKSDKILSLQVTFFRAPANPTAAIEESLKIERSEIEKSISEAISDNNKANKDNEEKILLLADPVPRKVLVGPQVAEQMKSMAIYAVLWACFFICGYIWFRFQFVWGIAAVIALVHDVLISLAFISLNNYVLAPALNWPIVPINLIVMAALLTIVGYSINDTIIVYDRIRENLKAPGKLKLDFFEVTDQSINQTLSRTVLTSVTTLFVIIAMMAMGGSEIYGFAFTMFIGILTGTYSSIFVAAPIILIFKEWFGAKDKSDNKKGKKAESEKAVEVK